MWSWIYKFLKVQRRKRIFIKHRRQCFSSIHFIPNAREALTNFPIVTTNFLDAQSFFLNYCLPKGSCRCTIKSSGSVWSNKEFLTKVISFSVHISWTYKVQACKAHQVLKLDEKLQNYRLNFNDSNIKTTTPNKHFTHRATAQWWKMKMNETGWSCMWKIAGKCFGCVVKWDH